MVVDTINVPEVSNLASEIQVESSPSKKVVDIKSLPFQCPKCPKTFQFKSRLQRHLTTHQVFTNILFSPTQCGHGESNELAKDIDGIGIKVQVF